MKRRIKLNMLEPGILICKICGGLLLLAAILYFLSDRTFCFWIGGAAAGLFLVLLILVKIELHQDEQDYLRWKDGQTERKDQK